MPSRDSYPPTPDSSPPLHEHRRLRVERLKTLSRLLDKAITIPGTDWGVGLDPIVGVVTGGGDVFTGLISAYIVWEAAKMGLPKATLLRMLGNIALDTLVGVVPGLGDVFDVVWHANARNVALVEQHLSDPQTQEVADRGFVVMVVAAIVILVIAVAGLSLWLLVQIIQWLQ